MPPYTNVYVYPDTLHGPHISAVLFDSTGSPLVFSTTCWDCYQGQQQSLQVVYEARDIFMMYAWYDAEPIKLQHTTSEAVELDGVMSFAPGWGQHA